MSKYSGVSRRAWMFLGGCVVAAGMAFLSGQSASASIFATNCQSLPAPAVNWSNCNFTLQKKELSFQDLRGANLNGATLGNSSFFRSNLTGANLSGVTFNWTSFLEANLTDANLTNTIYANDDMTSHVNFGMANMTRANLSGDTFSYVSFAGANLTSANLSNAVLVNASFSKANLSSANVSGLALGGAIFSGTNLLGATGVTKRVGVYSTAYELIAPATTCPNGELRVQPNYCSGFSSGVKW
jgi:uncharacterized protein YjbI with pentapeptide repeats